jgi:S-formylglutathione hydrolase
MRRFLSVDRWRYHRRVYSSQVNSIEEIGSNKCFEGHWKRYRHASNEASCDMTFSAYIPPRVSSTNKRPVLWFLSGLECNDRNFVDKAGAARIASELGLILICPDTSPRGLGYPGEDESWDFGTGAGMYVDATQPPWNKGYRMYSYVAQELPRVVEANLSVDLSRQGISGHSMGGHGALIVALKNPGRFQSVSAFAPIVSASKAPWGINAYSKYLGPNTESWKEWDVCELGRKYTGPAFSVLIDQGTADKFLVSQLRTHEWGDSISGKPITSTVRMQTGYDHGYFFVSSFMDDHLKFHAQALVLD